MLQTETYPMIVYYDRKIFIVQAVGLNLVKLFFGRYWPWDKVSQANWALSQFFRLISEWYTLVKFVGKNTNNFMTRFCHPLFPCLPGQRDTNRIASNQDKSAAIFCHQVAAWLPDSFCNFYLVKSHKIVNTSATTEAREKNKPRFEILRILDIFWCMFN